MAVPPKIQLFANLGMGLKSAPTGHKKSECIFFEKVHIIKTTAKSLHSTSLRRENHATYKTETPANKRVVQRRKK